MRTCGQCVSYGDRAGMRDHGRCVSLEGVRLPLWVDEAMSEGRAIVHVSRNADACAAYCLRVKPIGSDHGGAPWDWRTPYEKWLDENKEG